MVDNPDMAGATQDGLETVDSLRRRGLIPAAAYQRHLESPTQESFRPSILLQPLALLMALLGGVLGVFGAVLQELQSGGIGGPFIAAPIIEEALKPAGILHPADRLAARPGGTAAHRGADRDLGSLLRTD